MESFFNGLQRYGVGRLTAILGAAAGIAAVILAIVLNISAQPQSLLYSNLDLKEASEITSALGQAGIKYEARGDGSTIMVNRDQVADARMMLASKGLPTQASVGYEIFDNAPALGQTEAVQNINNQRALEGELARTIRTLRGISSARVHLVMPKRELFEDSANEPTASVVLGLSAGTLNSESVAAIRNVVATAVPNLKADNVTIVDDRNHLLAAGGDGDNATGGAGAQRKSEIEDSVRKRVMDIVEGVVGPGAARVMVTAEIDQTATTREQVEYNPDGQVVRSTSTNSGTETTSDPNSAGQTTVSANMPGGQQAPTIATGGNNSNQESEVTNFEISTTKTTEVKGPGEIRKLSVAVVVDGIETPSADGKTPPAYAPRSAEDMQRIQELVQAAVGYDQTRGDQVRVSNIRFNRGDFAAGTDAKAPLFDFDKNDIMRAIEVAVLFLVAILVIFLVARPLLKFINGGGTGVLAGTSGAGQPALAGAAVTGPSISYQAADNIAATGLVPTVEQEQRIDIARIEGQVKASSVKKVSEFVDRHPEQSVSILRAWLHDS
ncbi:flagellar basal-body MS-ring/collar protein FliF [Asticcacaulis sp. AC402]|uniref:flagellar basal-body MS-ring/collar protein FliF n=1 Tax=Asticcacaulis sp. AC402 TaxID=1282361 RepID=UPI0003C3AEE6|nr:flagellar basal-body MS-ring/collar protein FliF [Asticcacaulis sp. AC402]ESQ76018.1 flagellar M-ring protein FliF [Asticcacaulis sp. AC402]